MDARDFYYTVLNTILSQNKTADAFYRSSSSMSAAVIRFLAPDAIACKVVAAAYLNGLDGRYLRPI